MKIILLVGMLTILVLATNGNTILRGDSKIIGGSEAAQGDYPFMVSVHQDTNFLCAGVLIDVFWVLTSGICVYNDQLKPLKVSVGGVLYTGDEVGRYDIAVASLTMHDDFYTCSWTDKLLNLERVPSFLYCDNLALLKLNSPAMPSAYVQPIALTEPTEITPPNTIAKVAGWGGNANNPPSNTLQVSNDHHTMDNVDCSLIIGINLTNLDVCTDDPIQDTCEFDQGGPLFKSDARGYVLIGIVNYAPCGIPYPNIYASTTGQRWWIKKITGF